MKRPKPLKRRLRRKIQGFRRWLLYIGALATGRCIRLLPDASAVNLGAAAGSLAYFLLPGVSRRMMDHMAMAFGEERDAPERRRIAREVLRNCGRMMAEVALLERWSADELGAKVSFEGPEEFLRDLREGRPLIIVSGHFGNWEIVASYLARCLNAPLLAVMRRMSNPWMEELSISRRRAAGFEVFPRDGDARELMERIRSGKILVALVDQDTRKGQTIFVPFFGRPANTTRGPAFLAYRMKIPVYPAFAVRNPGGLTHTVRVEPAIVPRGGLPRDEDMERIVAEYTAAVERYVRRYPEQWMWMHRRWRRRPEEAPFRRRKIKKTKRMPPEDAPRR